MNREKLDRLIRDGYQPAAVLESSPGSYQAIITVPKLGTAHDRDVGNRLSDALNREYGDPHLSGSIHPHRAPGFQNKKPEHKREDGSYPVVRLLQAERRECVKLLGLSRQIDAEYQRQAAVQLARSLPGGGSEGVSSGSAEVEPILAYQRHYYDVLKRLPEGETDLSRVDSMVGMRMRVTGHDQEAIEEAIGFGAPRIRRTDEGRDWSDYAQRTARWAWSAEGDRQAERWAKYRQQWKKLEGEGA